MSKRQRCLAVAAYWCSYEREEREGRVGKLLCENRGWLVEWELVFAVGFAWVSGWDEWSAGDRLWEDGVREIRVLYVAGMCLLSSVGCGLWRRTGLAE